MENKRRKLGFTIVELLTVMAIIAILMGLLLPAMQAVRKLAKDTSQKAQFKTIDVALEAYASENGMYPESSESDPTTVTTNKTVGAHKLCEALVGRDMQGFDPKSSWDAYIDETSTDSTKIYASLENPPGSTQDEVNASLKRRQDLYLAADKVEAFQVNQLFNDTGDVYPGNLNNSGETAAGDHLSAPVMTDVYRSKKVTLKNGTTVIAGTPILYYKADITSKDFPDTMETTSDGGDDLSTSVTKSGLRDFIYDVNDNDELVNLYQMMRPSSTNMHHFDERYTEDFTVGSSSTSVNGLWLFYNTITNPKMPQPRPYNENSYILISAGNDGVYGTKDDIYNFSN